MHGCNQDNKLVMRITDNIVRLLSIYVRNSAHKGSLYRCVIVGVALILVIIAAFKLGNSYEQISSPKPFTLPAQQWRPWNASELSQVQVTVPAKQAPLPVKRTPLLEKQVPLPGKQATLPLKQAPLPLKQAPLPLKQAPLPLKQAPLPVKQASLPGPGANELASLNATTQVNITTLTARAKDVHFSLPCPRDVYKPVSEVMQAEWVDPLLTILDKFSKRSKQVTLVVANHAYQDVLLNWLISAVVVAKPPIENILVVALDKQLYDVLLKRQVPSSYASISVPLFSILNTKYSFSRNFETTMMIRLGFMRLINWLGFDCAMYDIDAVILKNPQPLYEKDKSDIIGSRGKFPRPLMRKWKVTICIGAVLIRSNTRTGG